MGGSKPAKHLLVGNCVTEKRPQSRNAGLFLGLSSQMQFFQKAYIMTIILVDGRLFKNVRYRVGSAGKNIP